MTEVTLKWEINQESILLHELIHRTNNEFASLIGAASRTAARSVNHEVKAALAHIIELLSHYAELHRALQMPENPDRWIAITGDPAYLRTFDDVGHRMVPTHATKTGVRYRYYVSFPHLHVQSLTHRITNLLDYL
jgi:hypothetical protein